MYLAAEAVERDTTGSTTPVERSLAQNSSLGSRVSLHEPRPAPWRRGHRYLACISRVGLPSDGSANSLSTVCGGL